MIEPRRTRLRGFLRIVRHRWGGGLLFLGVVVAVVGYGTFFVPPTYRADAILVLSAIPVSDPEANPPDSEPEIDRPLAGSMRVAGNHLGRLTSRSLVGRWVTAAALGEWPEYRSRSKDQIVESVRKRLSASRVPESDLVRVVLDGRDPDRVQAGLNTLVDLFLTEVTPGEGWKEARARLEAEDSRNRADGQTLRSRLLELQKNGEGRISETELSERNRNVLAAQDSLARAEEEAEILEKKRELATVSVQAGEPVEVLLQILSDPESLSAVRKLRRMRQEAIREQSRLLSRPGYRVDDRSRIESRIAGIDAEIDGAVRMAQTLFQRRLAEARLLVASRKARHVEALAAAKELRARQERFRTLVDHRDENRRRGKEIRERKAELRLARAEQGGAIRAEIVDPATRPLHPVHPDPVRNMAIGLLVGLFGGLGVVVLLEFLDDSIKGTGDVRRCLNLPSLGYIPQLNGTAAKTGDPGHPMELVTVHHPTSSASEAFRGICTGMFGIPGGLSDRNGTSSGNGNGLGEGVALAQVVLVTSACRGDGKTTTAVNMAVSMAQAGHETLLIDANLKEPKIHHTFEMDNQRGITTLVKDQAKLAHLVRPTRVDRLSVLPSGPLLPNPSNVLQGRNFNRALQQLRKRYQRIVLDSSAILDGNDAVVLGKLADTTLMVVGAYRTSREQAAFGKEYLTGLGIRVGGVILNRLRRGNGVYYAKDVEYPLLEG